MFLDNFVVYAIMRNEIHNLEPFINQFDGVDRIVLLDTGSTDGTYEKAKDLASRNPMLVVEQAIIDPFDFSIARNMALNVARNGADERSAFLWLDMDERLVGNYWYSRFLDWYTDAQPTGNWALLTTMIFSRSTEGKPLNTYKQRKIHSLDGFEWKYSCHEVLTETCPVNIYQSALEIEHFPDRDKERDYLPILENAYHKNPNDLRNIYYYGRELYYKDRMEEAAEILKTSDMASKNATVSQLIEAYILCAECYSILGNREQAELFYYSALSKYSNCCKAFLGLARESYYAKNYIGQLYWAQNALQSIDTAHINVIYNTTSEMVWQIYDFNALAYDALGNHAEALKYYALLLQNHRASVPQEDLERIQNNIVYLTSKLQPAEPL